jgi:hypothetical protein
VSKPKEFSLQYSPIVSHIDTLELTGSGTIKQVSPRFALLYFVSRVCDNETKHWTLQPNDIDPANWTVATGEAPKNTVSEGATPQRDARVAEPYPPRNFRPTTLHRAMEASRKQSLAEQEAHRRQRMTRSSGALSTSTSQHTTQHKKRIVHRAQHIFAHRRTIRKPTARFLGSGKAGKDHSTDEEEESDDDT